MSSLEGDNTCAREPVTVHVLVVDTSESVRAAMCAYMHEASPWSCAGMATGQCEDTAGRSEESAVPLVEFCAQGVGSTTEALRVLAANKVSIVIINDWFDHTACLEVSFFFFFGFIYFLEPILTHFSFVVAPRAGFKSPIGQGLRDLRAPRSHAEFGEIPHAWRRLARLTTPSPLPI